jgi:hypothetical protein
MATIKNYGFNISLLFYILVIKCSYFAYMAFLFTNVVGLIILLTAFILINYIELSSSYSKYQSSKALDLEMLLLGAFAIFLLVGMIIYLPCKISRSTSLSNQQREINSVANNYGFQNVRVGH